MLHRVKSSTQLRSGGMAPPCKQIPKFVPSLWLYHSHDERSLQLLKRVLVDLRPEVQIAVCTCCVDACHDVWLKGAGC